MYVSIFMHKLFLSNQLHHVKSSKANQWFGSPRSKIHFKGSSRNIFNGTLYTDHHVGGWSENRCFFINASKSICFGTPLNCTKRCFWYAPKDSIPWDMLHTSGKLITAVMYSLQCRRKACAVRIRQPNADALQVQAVEASGTDSCQLGNIGSG